MAGKSHLHIFNRLWWGLLTVLAIICVIVLYGIHYNMASKPEKHMINQQQKQGTRIVKTSGHNAVKTVPKKYMQNPHVKNAQRGAQRGAQKVQQNHKVQATKRLINKRMKK